MAFFVVQESVWIEEGLAARGVHQPHRQVYFAYMCANSSMGRLMDPPCSPQPGIGILVSCPQLNAKGLCMGGDGLL